MIFTRARQLFRRAVDRYKRTHRIFRRVSLTVTISMVTITIVSGAFTILMARVPEYRLQMQEWISERAKLDVQFAELSARWYHFGPQLEFTDAVIRTRDGKRILAMAKSGSLGFDLWTAIRTARLTALQFALRGTELNAVRKPNGVFEIVGQADLPEYEHHESFDLNSIPVGRVAISDVRLVFRDLKAKHGPWIVDNVDLSIERDNDSFEVEGQATLPNMLGKQLKFSASGEGQLDAVSQLQWHAQVKGHDLNLKGWARVMPDDWIAPREGLGGFELSAEFLGAHLQGFAGTVDFNNVLMNMPVWKTPLPVADTLRITEDGKQTSAPAVLPEPMTLSNVSAPLQYKKVSVAFKTVLTSEGWQTQFNKLQLEQEYARWEPSTASLLIKFADVRDHNAVLENGEPVEHHVIEQLNASAQLVVLDNLWPLLAFLPESEKLARLRALNASGRIQNASIRYERDLLFNTPTASSAVGDTESSADAESGADSDDDAVAMSAPRYSFRATFSEVGVSPVGRTPGVSGLSGTVEGTGAHGTLHLDSGNVELAIPHLFRTPLPADHITATMDWTRTVGNTRLHSDDVVVKSPNGDATAQLTLDIPQDGSPVIDAHAQGVNLEADSAPRYMPAGIMPRKVLEWLDNAFVAGKVRNAELTLKGPLKKFPFRENEGLFLITADIDNLSLQYQPGWMPATALQVQAEFRNVGFSANASSGLVNGMIIENAAGGIADFHEAQLRIKGQVHGDLSQGLRYMQQSPIGPMIGSLFQQVTGSGAIQASANLLLPLKDISKRQIDVDVRLQNSTMGLASSAQQATGVEGKLHIANETVVGVAVQGQFLHGAVSALSATDGSNNIIVNGRAQSAPLAEFLRLPAFVDLQGDLNYRFVAPGYAKRDASGHRVLFAVDSDLMGMQVNMPAPAYKNSSVSRPIHVEAEMQEADTMQLRGSMDQLKAIVRLQSDKSGWKFERAGLRVDGAVAALPGEPGLRIEGSMPDLVLDDWLKLGNCANSNSIASSGTTSSASSSVPASTFHVQDILRSTNLRVGKLHLYGYEWNDIRAVMQAMESGWQIDVASDNAAGQINVPYTMDARPLTIDMDKLTLISSNDAAHAAREKKASQLDPRDMPALQINVKDFHFGDHGFGIVQAHALRTPQGLQVDNMQIESDSFKGNGSGTWEQVPGSSQVNMMFAIESTDMRKTLQLMHFGEFISAKHGKLQGSLNWQGGIDEDLLGRASGSLELQLEDGQLLTVQPGAGRMLGLMSIVELPRRLRLDFRDVTDKGLAFDSIHGTFTIKDGDATTPNLLLRGPVAEIGIAGRIGLGKRDYDQTAVVTGDVGSALPVAGVALANPVVGGALLLFSQIFKEPLKGIARAYYHISGSWDEPKVDRLDQVAGKASMLNTVQAASSSSSSAAPLH